MRVPSTQVEGFRVISLETAILEKFRKARDANDAKNHDYLAHIVKQRLPGLVKELMAMRVTAMIGKSQTTRLPFALETLQALDAAAQQTGMDRVQLLRCCIAQEVNARAPRKTSGRRPTRTTRKRGAK